MGRPLLKIGSFFPPLLEQQISPPYRIIARHIEYLQKWREYLLLIWTGDSHTDKNYSVSSQKAVDDLISTILLMDFVRQEEPTAIPSLKETLKTVGNPTAYSLCETIHSQASCQLLKLIFDPNLLISPNIEPRRNVEWFPLARISESIDTLYGSQMPISLFGDFHQLCLDRPIADHTVRKGQSQRRIQGIHYTPAALVDYLVHHTLDMAFRESEPKQVEQLRILDPSCGCGAFLVAAFRYILRWFCDQYKSKQKAQRMNPQKSIDLLESMVFGTDIDERAIEWTRKLLLLTVWHYWINSSVSKSEVRNLTVPDLKDNFTCKDFLQIHPGDFDGPPRMSEPFDIIIGGPPFVRIQQLYRSAPELVDNYRRNFRTAKNGQFDLYMLFIEKSIQLLAKEGYLSLSVSGSFLSSESGQSLRELIAETCYVDEIVEFEDRRLYPNANVPIVLLMLRKTHHRGSTRHVFVEGKGGLRRKLTKVHKRHDHPQPFVHVHTLPTTACTSKNWVLKSERTAALLLRIEAAGTPLGKLPIQICFGAATGADNIFFLRNVECLNTELVLAESRFLNDVFVFESSVLRPVLRGRHTKSYGTLEPRTLCIFPYDSSGKMISEDILRAYSPRIYKYLVSCQTHLNNRKLKPDQLWYGYKSEKITQVIQSPKLVASVVNSGGGFTLDANKNIFCNNSVIILRPDENIINSHFLLGVLNSSVFKIWTQHLMPALGSGWYSYRIRVMSKFPLPMPRNRRSDKLFSEIADKAHQLLCIQHTSNARTDIMSSIDNKVVELYGITDIRSR